MVLLQNTNQMFPCNACAPLGHCNRAMSQKALDNTNRGSDRLESDACGVAMFSLPLLPPFRTTLQTSKCATAPDRRGPGAQLHSPLPTWLRPPAPGFRQGSLLKENCIGSRVLLAENYGHRVGGRGIGFHPRDHASLSIHRPLCAASASRII